jgi:hypothetical protein
VDGATYHDDLQPIGENPSKDECLVSSGKGATCPTDFVPHVKVTHGS